MVHGLRTVLERAFALALALLGVLLVAGGLQLLRLGGSPWYAAAGIALLALASLAWRGHGHAGAGYAAFLLATSAWAVWESGSHAWALTARLALPAVLGLWFLVPLQSDRPRGTRRWAGVVSLAMLAGLAGLHMGDAYRPRPVLSLPVAAVATGAGESPEAGDWPRYGNDGHATRYSPLAGLRVDNVARLKLAWSFRTGDLAKPGQEYNFEATPLKVGPLLYACTPSGQVVALDAATGQLAWRFDAQGDYAGIRTFICRGVSYYRVPAAPAVASSGHPREAPAGQGGCSERIYVATPDNRLWSLDATSGAPCAAFGVHGAVDLRAGLGDVKSGQYSVTSPPIVTHGRLIVGARVQDNVSTDMPSGVVRAFDAVTGALSWVWDVGRTDKAAQQAAGAPYTRSTPNAWAPMVADEQLGLVYIPTGNAAADFWGRHRRPFDERYSAAIVAVDAATGETRWVFQTTHHDVWDNDISAQPVLVDLPTPGGVRPALVAGTKQGNLFVLDRRSGEPIVPVAEEAVPQRSDIGERLSPTQPRSALALNPGPERLDEKAMWGLTPLDQMLCRIRFRQARYDGRYTPPGITRPTLAYPGMFGGIEWGSVAIDPQRAILVANPSAMPFLLRMAPSGKGAHGNGAAGPEGTATGLEPTEGTGYAASYFGFLSPLKVPCMQPPWGKLYAVDLGSARVLWERPVGDASRSGPFGKATHVPLPVGTPQVGGPLVTAGGLVFASATLDDTLRAYELASGRELWSARLPAGGQATPMSYAVGGRQYVAIAAGGHGVLGTKAGDFILAWSLD
jgi:quinoprotein glucose dehydrogenase